MRMGLTGAWPVLLDFPRPRPRNFAETSSFGANSRQVRGILLGRAQSSVRLGLALSTLGPGASMRFRLACLTSLSHCGAPRPQQDYGMNPAPLSPAKPLVSRPQRSPRTATEIKGLFGFVS